MKAGPIKLNFELMTSKRIKYTKFAYISKKLSKWVYTPLNVGFPCKY